MDRPLPTVRDGQHLTWRPSLCEVQTGPISSSEVHCVAPSPPAPLPRAGEGCRRRGEGCSHVKMESGMMIPVDMRFCKRSCRLLGRPWWVRILVATCLLANLCYIVRGRCVCMLALYCLDSLCEPTSILESPFLDITGDPRSQCVSVLALKSKNPSFTRDVDFNLLRGDNCTSVRFVSAAEHVH